MTSGSTAPSHMKRLHSILRTVYSCRFSSAEYHAGRWTRRYYRADVSLADSMHACVHAVVLASACRRVGVTEPIVEMESGVSIGGGGV
jgi:hypothetical protein